jgi:hypothetical protein
VSGTHLIQASAQSGGRESVRLPYPGFCPIRDLLVGSAPLSRDGHGPLVANLSEIRINKTGNGSASKYSSMDVVVISVADPEGSVSFSRIWIRDPDQGVLGS